MMRVFLAFVLALLAPLSARAESKPFQKVERCKMKADRWNDGDSFHVITGDAQREIVARLYFVDTPEAETAYRDRIDEQAAESSSRGFYTYWGSGFNLDFGRDENERVGHLFADGSWRNRSVVYWFDLANRHQV